MISKRQFLFALAGLVAALLALDHWAGKTPPNTVPRRLMAHARQFSHGNVLALGNSIMGVGFEESAFDRSIGSSPESGGVDLGMGASIPVEHLLLLRYALQTGMRPGTIVYGFYDFQLTHPAELTTADFISSQSMLYYVEPEFARGFYHLSFHDSIEFEIMRRFPALADRGDTWERVELFRRRISQQGMPQEKTNALGRTNDFALLEYHSTPEFIEECARASQRDLIPAISEIIREGSQNGRRVVFVEMPMPPAHVQSFYETDAWQGYRAHLRAMLEAEGVTYIDASHWAPDGSMFMDPLHLTYEGSKEFSRRLGETLFPARKSDPD